MKPSLSYVLLFFTIATQSLFSSTITSIAAAADIKDSKGEKISDYLIGYHFGRVTPAKGGRINSTDTINNEKVCPLDVVQDPSEDNLGSEYVFTPFGGDFPDDRYLHTSNIIGINSGYAEGGCRYMTFWVIPDAEGPPPSNLITTGGGIDDPEGCFRFMEYPEPTSPEVPSYMLQHCPSFCDEGPRETCFNISTYLDNGVTRLGVTGGTPFEFVFYKAIESGLDSM